MTGSLAPGSPAGRRHLEAVNQIRAALPPRAPPVAAPAAGLVVVIPAVPGRLLMERPLGAGPGMLRRVLGGALREGIGHYRRGREVSPAAARQLAHWGAAAVGGAVEGRACPRAAEQVRVGQR